VREGGVSEGVQPGAAGRQYTAHRRLSQRAPSVCRHGQRLQHEPGQQQRQLRVWTPWEILATFWVDVAIARVQPILPRKWLAAHDARHQQWKYVDVGCSKFGLTLGGAARARLAAPLVAPQRSSRRRPQALLLPASLHVRPAAAPAAWRATAAQAEGAAAAAGAGALPGSSLAASASVASSPAQQQKAEVTTSTDCCTKVMSPMYDCTTEHSMDGITQTSVLKVMRDHDY